MYSINEKSTAKNQALTEDKVLSIIDGLIFCQVGRKSLEKYSKFVYDVYVDSYKKRNGWEPVDGELEHMIQEDKEQFEHSYYFAFKTHEGEFVGGAKVTKKVPSLDFAIETEFNYNLKEFFEMGNIPTRDFWHMGRTAINKYTLQAAETKLSSVQILDKLMWECYNVVTQEEHNMIIGEADAMAYRIYRVKGVHVQRMGEGIDYLGSITYPVFILGKDLKSWMNINSHLS
ncbi:hypothetical protein [Microscilla marina]|uniref:Uncharacterized protein n=1 Tax=Microscilla marina ATCC 23134 TaxID=313606 RepID=A1ZWU7_MICM2|nr:hypothetical protein [Microscilla marina]EAY25124.1 hypothetical protein M23134_05894 [Microscilla marina ATCC 23134]